MAGSTRLHDLIRGTNIRKTSRFLAESDTWSKQELEQYQSIKLKRLIKYCYDNVPFYHNVMENAGLSPSDIQNIADIRKLPVLTKEVVREHSADFLSRVIDYSSSRVLKSKTGGTTGMPLVFYKDTQTRDFTWGSVRRWYTWMGLNPDKDKKAVLWGQKQVLDNSYSLKEKILSILDKTLKINSFNLNQETLPEVARKLIDFDPIFIRGYLSAIYQVAVYFKEHSLTLPSLKAISSTTETLMPIYRRYIEETFGVKMFDQYGCGECNGIAFECMSHEGLHITEEHCIVEILDDNGNSVKDKVGRVVITDLDNYAFPFIRYENGDSAAISSKECTCGRHTALLTDLSGRTKDTVFLKDGSEVHGVFFTDIFHELGYDNFEYFTRFQIYQNKKGSILLRLEKTQKDLSSDKLNIIKDTLAKYCESVDIVMLDQLEHDASGKFRYIISDL